jgi:hypothetical protein
MTLPKLSYFEYEEMNEEMDEELIVFYQKFIWFISISSEFFDNMYGNIYEDYYIKNKEYEEEEEENE